MRKSEITGIVKILENPAEYETPEEAAKAIIQWLDEDRIKRTGYVAVMQFGREQPWYVGLGPYPGEASARKAAKSFPGIAVAAKAAIVPVMPPGKVEQRLREIDALPKRDTSDVA